MNVQVFFLLVFVSGVFCPPTPITSTDSVLENSPSQDEEPLQFHLELDNNKNPVLEQQDSFVSEDSLEPVGPVEYEHYDAIESGNNFVEKDFDSFKTAVKNNEPLDKFFEGLNNYVYIAKVYTHFLFEVMEIVFEDMEDLIKKEFPKITHQMIYRKVDRIIDQMFYPKNVLNYAVKWLEKRAPEVDNHFSNVMLDVRDGLKYLTEFIARIEYGVYSEIDSINELVEAGKARHKDGGPTGRINKHIEASFKALHGVADDNLFDEGIDRINQVIHHYLVLRKG